VNAAVPRSLPTVWRPAVPPDRMPVVVAAAGAVVLGALTVYSPKYAIAAAAVAPLVALAFSRLALGVALFAAVTFPEHLPGSLGAGATLAKPLGVVLALAWVATVAARRGGVRLLARDQPVVFWAVVALLALSAASAIWASDLGQTRFQLGRLAQVAVLLLVVYTAASASPRAFRQIVWGFLLGSFVTGVYSLVTRSYIAGGRLAGLFDPNAFASELIPAILVSAFVFLTAASRRTQLAAFAVFVVGLVGFALTQSRGGIAGLTVALVAGIALAGRARPRVVALVLVIVALGAGYYLAYAPAHLQGSFSAGSLSAASSGRSDEWRIALRIIRNHPLNGVGLGNYVVVEPGYSTQTFNLNFVSQVVIHPLVAHNSYLETAAELGIAGVALFITILFLPLRSAVRALDALREFADDLEFYARGLIAGAMGMFAAYFFFSGQYEKQLWLIVGLLASLAALARVEDAEAPSTS
jgi:putative inorganic carbon (hco3(-)) transporter